MSEAHDIEADFIEGYLDGRNPTTPTPSDNRTAAYKHSFEIGRAEIEGRPTPPMHVSLAKAQAIIEMEKSHD